MKEEGKKARTEQISQEYFAHLQDSLVSNLFNKWLKQTTAHDIKNLNVEGAFPFQSPKVVAGALETSFSDGPLPIKFSKATSQAIGSEVI